jgi:heterodisulfide reductase subunit A-like polyferredoxin/coenzyme F420-reducing hydrogenase delta subunit
LEVNMKEGAPGILIIGGGVAGMAAARSLDHPDLSVHLVEEQDQLGGNAARWACMATDTCQNCGACLGHEMARQVADQPNITLHLKTKIHTLKKNRQGVEALLTSGKTILAAKVILTTGFSPFDPAKLPSLHWDKSDNIITTAQLNTLIRQDRLDTLFSDTPTPRIAFIQCVGSRNRELGKDYCSQTCCKISLRHSQKLIHEIPDAAITLFYMDLQLIGKEIRKTLETLSTKIELVQGVPAEILEDSHTHALTMVTEDAATQSRITRQFDLVVLSIGMESAQDINETAEALGAVPNDWGFFNTPEAILPQDLYIAGCAKGPKDILSSQQEGRIAGAKVLKKLGLAPTPGMTVAVIGGPNGARVAKAVAAEGYKVVTFGAGPETRILTLDGTAGNFSIYYEAQGKRQTLACGAIIAAPQACSTPNAGRGDFQSAMDLNTFANIAPKNLPEKNLILLDYFGPEFKVSARRALTLALATRKADKEITLLMNKMLVHGGLGQRLYDQARSVGIQFLRFNTVDDIKIQAENKGFHIRLREATLPNLEIKFSCDCLVLPDSIHACKDFEPIATLLRSCLDREGFLQPANVRHRLVQSQRKGIYHAGSGHDEVDDQEIGTQIQEILSLLNTQGANLKTTRVTINEKHCAQCLTCYRICPHAAIILDEEMQPQIMENACFSCHLCLSNCPACAIESDNTHETIAGSVSNRASGQGEQKQVVIFACERSAALAAENTRLPEKTQVISLPCACRISPDMILKALINGASKVIVSGCHEGNCRSMEGSTTARSAVDAVVKMPGIFPGQITWEPVAANETDKLGRIIARALPGLKRIRGNK